MFKRILYFFKGKSNEEVPYFDEEFEFQEDDDEDEEFELEDCTYYQ